MVHYRYSHTYQHAVQWNAPAPHQADNLQGDLPAVCGGAECGGADAATGTTVDHLGEELLNLLQLGVLGVGLRVGLGEGAGHI